MSYSIFRFCKWRVLVAALFALAVQAASAGNGPLVSGSYKVLQNQAVQSDRLSSVHSQSLQNKEAGSRARITMRIHLVNHGPSDLFIQRMTLWDSSHREKGGTSVCSLTLHAGASADSTQEFTIPRSDFEQWERGLRPRLVLRLGTPRSSKSTVVVRLDRISSKEVN